MKIKKKNNFLIYFCKDDPSKNQNSKPFVIHEALIA